MKCRRAQFGKSPDPCCHSCPEQKASSNRPEWISLFSPVFCVCTVLWWHLSAGWILHREKEFPHRLKKVKVFMINPDISQQSWFSFQNGGLSVNALTCCFFCFYISLPFSHLVTSQDCYRVLFLPLSVCA